MASKKKESEGIMLLSMYNDEDDDEMEDAGAVDDGDGDGGREDWELVEEEEEEDGDRMEGAEKEENARVLVEEEVEDVVVGLDEGGDGDGRVRVVVVESREKVEVRRTTEKVAIVDYAHDEVAVSPINEGVKIQGESFVVGDESSQSVDGDFQYKLTEETIQVLTPHDQAISLSSEHMNSWQHETGNLISTESNATEGDDPARTSGAIDPLDKFLPPPPTALCLQELQDKVSKFLKYKKAGKSFNAEVRNRKDYRNPDFLLHAMRYQGIDQVGSCFSKDVFDPHGYDQCDYYDEIEADMKREQERKEQTRKKNLQIDFVSGGAQAAVAAALQKVNISVTGAPLAVGDGLRSADTASRGGRQKKSKWDKVDDDRKATLPPVGKESISAAAAHAMVPTANAGAGYTAFAQQRRREAEERRSADRKPDRRS